MIQYLYNDFDKFVYLFWWDEKSMQCAMTCCKPSETINIWRKCPKDII